MSHAKQLNTADALRCALLVPSLARAGAETQTVLLANWLASAGHYVDLWTLGGESDLASRVSQNVKLEMFARRSRLDLRQVKHLARLIDDNGIQVLICAMQFATLMGWLARRRAKHKPLLVSTLHTTVNKGLKEEIQDRFLYVHLLRRASGLVFVCAAQRDYWEHRHPGLSKRSIVIHNGVAGRVDTRKSRGKSAQKLRSQLGIPEGVPIFCCVARLRPEKGHHDLMHALASLRAPVHLLLAGDGPCRLELEELAQSLGLASRVHFLGDVEMIEDVYLASQVMVLASTAVETFSMAILEAMAEGLAIIASRIGGISEAVREGQDGFLFTPGDRSELARLMQVAADNRDLFAEMGKQGARRVHELFTADTMGSAYQTYLRGIVRARSPSCPCCT